MCSDNFRGQPNDQRATARCANDDRRGRRYDGRSADEAQTVNVFGVAEPKAGRHFTCVTPNRSAAAFARMVRTVITVYAAARPIHRVVDNLNTHREQALTDHFGREDGHTLWRRLTVHDTPKHVSWLNQAEIELSLVTRQCHPVTSSPDDRIVRALLREIGAVEEGYAGIECAVEETRTGGDIGRQGYAATPDFADGQPRVVERVVFQTRSAKSASRDFPHQTFPR